MPAVTVVGPVLAFVPLRTKAAVALFCPTPFTFEPMAALIVVTPVPAPTLVTVPALLTLPVAKVIVPVVALLLIVRLLFPVTPPCDARTMGLLYVRPVVLTSSDAAALPLVLPRVTAAVPRALAEVLAVT